MPSIETTGGQVPTDSLDGVYISEYTVYGARYPRYIDLYLAEGSGYARSGQWNVQLIDNSGNYAGGGQISYIPEYSSICVPVSWNGNALSAILLDDNLGHTRSYRVPLLDYRRDSRVGRTINPQTGQGGWDIRPA